MEQSNIIERQWHKNDASIDAEETRTHNNPVIPTQEPLTHEEELSQDNIIANPQFRGQLAKKFGRPIVWAIGGGKGGVGKSLISANFSIALAQKGFKVLALDLDIGGSNLHTCLGSEPPKNGLGEWVLGKEKDLSNIWKESKEPLLQFISGAQDTSKIHDIIYGKLDALMEVIKTLPFEHVVLDLGAGTSPATVKAFTMADQGIITVLPEPTSVENAYRFIRHVIFGSLMDSDVAAETKAIIAMSIDQKNPLGVKTPHDLLAIVEKMNENDVLTLRKVLKNFQPQVVMNQVRNQIDVDVGRAIKSVCKRFFNVDVGYAGYLDHDQVAWKAIRAKRAIMHHQPRSVIASRLTKLTNKLLQIMLTKP